MPNIVLRAASWLAPAQQRPEWFKEWRSELAYVPSCHRLRFSYGAFVDALWLRRNSAGPAQSGARDRSPFLFLSALASIALAAILAGLPLAKMLPSQLAAAKRDFSGLLGVLLMYVALSALALLIGGRRLAPWPGNLKMWTYLAAKMILLIPVFHCALLVTVALQIPPLSVASLISYSLLVRWALIDQSRRCPHCLRSLTAPTRIGTSSQTFLQWFGTEYVCARGHGLLHEPDDSAAYCAQPRWLTLDASWSVFFPSAREKSCH